MTPGVIVLSIALAGSLANPAAQPTAKKAAPAAPAAHSWIAKIGSPPANEKFLLEGRVLDRDGKPCHDVRMHVHHANGEGQYYDMPVAEGGHMLCAAMLRTNVMGEYRVETVLPGMAEGTPHVHMAVEDRSGGWRYFTVNLARNTGPGSDKVFEKLPWMIKLPDQDHWAYVARDADNAFHCTFDIELRKATLMSEKPEGWVDEK